MNLPLHAMAFAAVALAGCTTDPKHDEQDSGAAAGSSVSPPATTSEAASSPALSSVPPSGVTSGAPSGAGGSPPANSGGAGGETTAPTTSAAGGSGGEVATETDPPGTEVSSTAPGTSPSDSTEGGLDAAVDPCPAVPDFTAPTKLSETGLFADLAAGTLAAGVRPYRPRFELWSDGATKRRFVYLPPCSQIDTTDPDYWNYPVGTKLWKEFTRDNEAGEPVRVETRLFQKRSPTKWFWTAFIWNDDQSDALIAEGDGPTNLIALENAKGTPHDVPGQKSCESCHYNMADQVLGFSALQLDFDAEPGLVDLATLNEEGLLSSAIAGSVALPGSAGQQEALGYMHANCGPCHNPNSKEANLELQFWLELGSLASVEETPTYLTTIGQISQSEQPPDNQPLIRVVPQDLENSAVYWRMTEPATYPATPKGGTHMPLIATEITDEHGLQLVADWINSLEPTQ